MSVIQKIRDKYARWAVIAIALSLIGFIMMDAFAGKGSLFNNRGSNTLGKINGTTIDRIEFDKQMQVFGARIPEEQRPGLIQNLWDYEVSRVVIGDEAEKLGLTVTDREMRNVLYGDNPPQFIAQYFTDPSSGKFDAVSAQQQVNALLKRGSPQDQYQFFTTNIDLTKNQRLMNKYMNLLLGSIYYPKWFLEKRNVDNSLIGKMSYVAVPYSSVPDSSIKVSDAEIMEYVKKNEDNFKRDKETRSVEYVAFSTAPSAADSAATKTEVENLKANFASTTDPGGFVNQQNSAIPFDNIFYAKSAIQVPQKDSILSTPKGQVFGPYLDATNWVLSRVVDVRNLPDSVKCRHILIGTVDMQTGQPTMSDSVAKAKADSVATAIRNGASFDLLDSLYSTDEAAKREKGVMTFSSKDIQSPNFAKEFGQFILFDGKPGDKKVLKTQFGWHYIEILSNIGMEPHYKVAYLAKPITTSPETDNEVHNLAAMFAGDARDYKTFNDYYEKNLKPKGYVKQVASDVDPMQFEMPGVNSSARPFVKDVFDADRGDVVGPVALSDNYVVGVVTAVHEPGLPDVATVRPMVEPVLRNKKKADVIIKNIGQVSSLEQAATKTNQPVQTLDSLRFNGGPSLGYEPKVLGALFNPANKGKLVTQPIAGNSGVFVIKVEDVTTTPVETANVDEQRTQLEMQAKNQIMQQMQYGGNPILEPLQKKASIKDYRSKFY